MERDVLVVHPYKNHVYHSYLGVAGSGSFTTLVTLFYRKGLFVRLASLLSKDFSAKAKDYYDRNIPLSHVHSPAWRQIRYMYERENSSLVIRRFDTYCAGNILSGRWKATAYHVFQDYLPLTCRAVKQVGSILVMEQIINQSVEALHRLEHSIREYGLSPDCFDLNIDEHSNIELMGIADFVLVPSNYLLSGISGRSNPNKIVHIPYGVDIETFIPSKPGDKNDESVRIAAWAKTARKGGHLLLYSLRGCGKRLLELAGGKQVEIHILGGWDRTLKGTYELCSRDIPDGIVIKETRIPHHEMSRFLTSCHLFLIPSLTEGMSLAALEAAASGLPLLITPYVGIDTFVDGRHGFLIDGGDSDLLSRALLRAFESRHRWEEMGRSARALACDHPWKRFEEDISKLYKERILPQYA